MNRRYVVVLLAIVAFALCVWWLRANEGKRGGDAQGDRPPALVSTEPIEAGPDTPTGRGTADPPRSDAQESPHMDLANVPSETVNAESAPPQSITFHELPLQPYAVNGVVPEPAVRKADASSEGWEKRTRTITVHADPKGCPECLSSQFNSIGIPDTCEYFSYTVSQLHRLPAAQIEESSKFTSYSDGPSSDATGRITAIWITAKTEKRASSPVTPSITMGLTVVVLCPNDSETKGWRIAAE